MVKMPFNYVPLYDQIKVGFGIEWWAHLSPHGYDLRWVFSSPCCGWCRSSGQRMKNKLSVNLVYCRSVPVEYACPAQMPSMVNKYGTYIYVSCGRITLPRCQYRRLDGLAVVRIQSCSLSYRCPPSSTPTALPSLPHRSWVIPHQFVDSKGYTIGASEMKIHEK